MAKNAHLTLDERATIEVSLREGVSFTEIGKMLVKDPSTISKEVKNHSQTVRKGRYNPCANRTSCLIWERHVNHANTHITVLARDARIGTVMSIALTLLNLHVRS